MNPRRVIPTLASCALLGLLAGCNSSAQSTEDIRVGVFAEAPVAGLAYATESLSGVTDAEGRYTYRAGESISFSLGNTKLGEPTPAAGTLSPLDIVPGAVAFRTVPEVRAALEHQDESFFALTNILVLLQTFDSDGDASRITIPAAIHDLLADAQLDIGVPPTAFMQDPALRHLAWRAASDGLIPTASPRKPGSALDNFYAAQGLDHDFDVPRRISRDVGNDSMVDLMIEFLLDNSGTASALTVQKQISGMLLDSALEQWTINSNGDVVWHSADVFDDALPASIWSTNYDELGLATIVSAPNGAGGESTTNVTRDSEGNETLTLDQNSDGLIDRVTTRRFDRGGRLTLETQDLNMDGTPDSTRMLTYDSNGLLAMERIEADEDANGDLDSIREILHNEQGQPTSANIDYNGDGVIDQIETWRYDSAGRLLEHASQNPSTGVSIALLQLQYDNAGRVTRRATTSDFIHTWTYDDDGVLTQSSTQCPSCTVPSVTNTRYLYDPAARRTTLENETWLAGVFSDLSLTIYEYDDAGVLTLWLRDDGADGSYELRIEYANQPGDWSSVLDTRIDQPPSFTVPAYYKD